MPYRIYNGSYGLSRLPSDVNSSLGTFSHSFDALAWSGGFTSVFANGNTNARYTSPDVSATPANGFNSIAVGGTDDSRTPRDASDDTVAAESAFIGPPSLHHDRVKPELLAPHSVCTIPGAGCGSGTSFAAPLVTGLVADLMQKLPIARGRPDTVKALLVANARAIAGSQVGAGFGQVSGVKLTGAMPWGNTRGLFMARTATCTALRATTPVVDLTPVDAFPVRVVMSWLSNGSSGAPTNTPFHDLDLVVVQLSNNAVVASSARFDSTIEVVDFTPIPNERYAVRVSARRCNSGMVPFTVGWRSSGASLQAVPSTIGSAP
ncbi:MAG: S8 family serine peptidase [Archangium sp.]|nr:S8 family serine peptidase [Archangium sp.]